MKRIAFALALLLCASAPAATGWGEEKVRSLRGDAEVSAPSAPPAGMDWKADDKIVARTFAHQPPLIPHAVAEYDISTSDNDCLDCHGEKDSGAPMPHQSHFVDRDGKATDNIARQWYFCTQCHVGQVDAKPLVDNTFQGK